MQLIVNSPGTFITQKNDSFQMNIMMTFYQNFSEFLTVSVKKA